MKKTNVEALENGWVKIEYARKSDSTIKKTIGTRNPELIKEAGGTSPEKWLTRGNAEPYFDKGDSSIKSFVVENLKLMEKI